MQCIDKLIFYWYTVPKRKFFIQTWNCRSHVIDKSKSQKANGYAYQLIPSQSFMVKYPTNKNQRNCQKCTLHNRSSADLPSGFIGIHPSSQPTSSPTRTMPKANGAHPCLANFRLENSDGTKNWKSIGADYPDAHFVPFGQIGNGVNEEAVRWSAKTAFSFTPSLILYFTIIAFIHHNHNSIFLFLLLACIYIVFLRVSCLIS